MGQKAELVKECKREGESCLFSSTALFLWLRWMRGWRAFFVVAPLILGSAASWTLLQTSEFEQVKMLTSVCSFLAGLLPAIYAAVRGDEGVAEVARVAGEYKNLQSRFRQCATVWSGRSLEEFEGEFDRLMERLERVRAGSITAPERYFKAAQMKVNSGDYEFDVDIEHGGELE